MICITLPYFVFLNQILGKHEKADGILLDLGFGSHQVDDRERGFSFSKDCPLDMRYDQVK